jgi:hypothetical protein
MERAMLWCGVLSDKLLSCVRLWKCATEQSWCSLAHLII